MRPFAFLGKTTGGSLGHVTSAISAVLLLAAAASGRTGCEELTYFSGASNARNLAPKRRGGHEPRAGGAVTDGSPRHEQDIAPP
jgi:hypothetical protein